MTMNRPIDGSLEQLLYDSADEDSLLIAYDVKDSPDREPMKYEVSPELTESVYHGWYVQIRKTDALVVL